MKSTGFKQTLPAFGLAVTLGIILYPKSFLHKRIESDYHFRKLIPANLVNGYGF